MKKGRETMNGNTELLNFIYQNSQMGVITIDQLLDICEDPDFKQHMKAQYDEYESINKAAHELLTQKGYDEKGISAFEKMRTYLMINMQTLTDKSSSHIAEMLTVGSTMGVIQAIRNIRKYQDDAEPNILDLMQRLLKFEENNISQLKQFI